MNTISVFSRHLAILLRPAYLGVGARALASGGLLANLHLSVRAGDRKRLFIGIDGDELGTLGTGFHHPVYYIVTGSADTDDLYIDNVLGTVFSFEIHSRTSH